MPALFDYNIEYPLQDFLADMQAFIESVSSNVIAYPPRVQLVDEETGEEQLYQLNTTNPLFKLTQHFLSKYDEEQADSLQWKFMQVIDYLGKMRMDLVKNGIANEGVNSTSYSHEFIDFLLRLPLNKSNGQIPANALKRFLSAKREQKSP